MRRTIFIDIEPLPALNLPAGGFPPVKPASFDENHLKTPLNAAFSASASLTSLRAARSSVV